MLNFRFNTSSNTQAVQVMEGLAQRPCAKPFLLPVDPSTVPDYYQVISQPIDISLIIEKLLLNKYMNVEEWIHDMHLIADNAKVFNGQKSYIYHMALCLIDHFEGELKKFYSHDSSLWAQRYQKISNKLAEQMKRLPLSLPSLASRQTRQSQSQTYQTYQTQRNERNEQEEDFEEEELPPQIQHNRRSKYFGDSAYYIESRNDIPTSSFISEELPINSINSNSLNNSIISNASVSSMSSMLSMSSITPITHIQQSQQANLSNQTKKSNNKPQKRKRDEDMMRMKPPTAAKTPPAVPLSTLKPVQKKSRVQTPNLNVAQTPPTKSLSPEIKTETPKEAVSLFGDIDLQFILPSTLPPALPPASPLPLSLSQPQPQPQSQSQTTSTFDNIQLLQNANNMDNMLPAISQPPLSTTSSGMTQTISPILFSSPIAPSTQYQQMNHQLSASSQDGQILQQQQQLFLQKQLEQQIYHQQQILQQQHIPFGKLPHAALQNKQQLQFQGERMKVNLFGSAIPLDLPGPLTISPPEIGPTGANATNELF